ncbi:hypothetical protein C8J56DRAFT_1171336 [Mycena floridula]|nr:hypothetical protein C8J56DRAFT_1171336 [Mycena floridula]
MRAIFIVSSLALSAAALPDIFANFQGFSQANCQGDAKPAPQFAGNLNPTDNLWGSELCYSAPPEIKSISYNISTDFSAFINGNSNCVGVKGEILHRGPDASEPTVQGCLDSGSDSLFISSLAVFP